MAVAKVCALDLKTITAKQRGILRNAGRKLEEVSEDRIGSFTQWWSAQWEGRDQKVPRIDQLLNNWGRYSAEMLVAPLNQEVDEEQRKRVYAQILRRKEEREGGRTGIGVPV